MKKMILSIALVLASQASYANVLTPPGTLHIFDADKSGAFAYITGDLAQALYDNGTSIEGTPHVKAIERFVCGTSSVGMVCLTVFKDLTAMEDSEFPVTSEIDIANASVNIWISGASALKLYNALEDALELAPGLRVTTDVICAKGDTLEKSVCNRSFYINGKHASTLSQFNKAGRNFPIIK